jgi:hypothetical protein
MLILSNGDRYFISHKGKKHQQYGGVSKWYNTKLLHTFFSAITGLGYDGAPQGKPALAKKLSLNKKEDKRLIYESLFGNNYGSKDYGVNNIHLILHGNIFLNPIDNDIYELSAECNVIANKKGEDVSKLGPFFMIASYRGDRSSKWLKNTRIQVSGPHHRNPDSLNFI